MCDDMGYDLRVTELEKLRASLMKGRTAHFFAGHLVQPLVLLESLFFDTLALTTMSRMLRGRRKAVIMGSLNILASRSSDESMFMLRRIML